MSRTWERKPRLLRTAGRSALLTPVGPLHSAGRAAREAEAEAIARRAVPDGRVGGRAGGTRSADDVVTQMESSLRHDFGGVRVHADADAAASAQTLAARAYTVGSDIYFGAGHFAPDTAPGRRLLAHELAHVAQQQRSGVVLADRADDPGQQAEHQFWLAVGHQANYGVLAKERRVPMARIGNAAADEMLWTIEAETNRRFGMSDFLHEHFGRDKELRVTSVVKDGEHRRHRKMDVARAGTTTWEELAAAAVHAGFWVHAEGVILSGQMWPLSPAATGAHLDLYLIGPAIGDYEPAPAAGPQGSIAT